MAKFADLKKDRSDQRQKRLQHKLSIWEQLKSGAVDLLKEFNDDLLDGSWIFDGPLDIRLKMIYDDCCTAISSSTNPDASVIIIALSHVGLKPIVILRKNGEDTIENCEKSSLGCIESSLIKIAEKEQLL